MLHSNDNAQSDNTTFQPVCIGEIELSKPLPDNSTLCGSNTSRYKRSRILVRLFSSPIGFVEIPLDIKMSSGDIAALLWQELQQPITQFLEKIGDGPIEPLSAAGISSAKYEPYLAKLNQLPPNPPSISVILCTRDRSEPLDKCLSHLINMDYPNYEIIVVDNAPATNATAELIKDKYGAVQNLKYCCEKHPGLSWARNYGLKISQAEIVVYIDDDEIPDSRWLMELVNGFQNQENVGCVTGMIVPAEIETQAQGWFEQYGGHSKGRGFDQLVFNKGTFKQQSPLFPNPPYGAGGNMAFKASVIRQLGGFDRALGAGTLTKGAEDTASYYDILTHGYTLVYRPAAITYHYHRRSYTELSNQFYGYGLGLTAFYVRCFLKNPGTIFEIMALFPKGIGLLLHQQFNPEQNPEHSFPKELFRTKVRGLLSGPWAYLKSMQNLSRVIKNDRTLNEKNPSPDQVK